ncbi:cell division protein FtsX [Acetobacter sacchari]|uniref:Cell division protein FtsX n=1 Tax=Acetobacter sacchari TaxID=2661687 RepID=A0ABS3M062_9PROT|nr:cell division protein FtsX [Acetobacter sacchari]MBO1361571.1 cell division protein FtsX [Acetobacter sacchari]
MSEAKGRRRDGLALSRALPDRSLLAMVAAMSLLASLTYAGAVGARAVSSRWAAGAANLVTVQVPDPEKPATDTTAGSATSMGEATAHKDGVSDASSAHAAQLPASQPEKQSGSINAATPDMTRATAIEAVLQASPDTQLVHRLNASEIDRLLAPWLGAAGASALPLPAVIEVHLSRGATLSPNVIASIAKIAPGSLIERNDEWRVRLLDIARSLLACAALAILLVGAIGAAVIAMATRLGLGARRESIEILHGLGAVDGYVASRFARRVAGLSLAGGMAGTLLALPPLAGIARLMAPLSGGGALTFGTGETGFSMAEMVTVLATLWGETPPALLWGLGVVPFAAAFIGWITAQVMVRVWLRRLP